MNLYYKVEAAFDGMINALEEAMNVADDGEETVLYSDLAIDIADSRDDAQSLYEKLIQKKNAAPAAATDETAKNEFANNSDLSIDKILENVKGAYLIAEQNPDGSIDVTADIKGDDLTAVYGAIVAEVYYTVWKKKLPTDKLTEIENKARNHAIRRVFKEEF